MNERWPCTGEGGRTAYYKNRMDDRTGFGLGMYYGTNRTGAQERTPTRIDGSGSSLSLLSRLLGGVGRRVGVVCRVERLCPKKSKREIQKALVSGGRGGRDSDGWLDGSIKSCVWRAKQENTKTDGRVLLAEQKSGRQSAEGEGRKRPLWSKPACRRRQNADGGGDALTIGGP